jgi:hypothetical protein
MLASGPEGNFNQIRAVGGTAAFSLKMNGVLGFSQVAAREKLLATRWIDPSEKAVSDSIFIVNSVGFHPAGMPVIRFSPSRNKRCARALINGRSSTLGMDA